MSVPHRRAASLSSLPPTPAADIGPTGKKVSVLPVGDVNSGPIASRRGLLEAAPIVR
jgi:hypothetical protein